MDRSSHKHILPNPTPYQTAAHLRPLSSSTFLSKCSFRNLNTFFQLNQRKLRNPFQMESLSVNILLPHISDQSSINFLNFLSAIHNKYKTYMVLATTKYIVCIFDILVVEFCFNRRIKGLMKSNATNNL